jgi:hypothetical protein
MEVMIMSSNAIAMCIILGIVAVAFIIAFFEMEREKQIQVVSNWLLYAVSIAEKELGGGTGKLKLRYVYDMFIDKFKFLSYIISFDYFSLLVDKALVEMRTIIENNKKIEAIISPNKTL